MRQGARILAGGVRVEVAPRPIAGIAFAGRMQIDNVLLHLATFFLAFLHGIFIQWFLTMGHGSPSAIFPSL